MRATPWQLGLASLAVLLIGLNAKAEDAIPFPAALDAAAVAVDRLDSVLDYALLIGNGDLFSSRFPDPKVQQAKILEAAFVDIQQRRRRELNL